ncbi:MAG: YlqD family protein [Candidatus Gastranaerophilales bacterium]|nr:YlqD family protein [Candidatus Gastranaerophilales bacterium]
MQKIKVKRPVTIRTVVTKDFKKQATEEILKEIHLIESQIMQLELQNQQMQNQMYSAGFNNEKLEHIQNELNEISAKLEQMTFFKQELQTQKESINHIGLENIIVTGSLENYVELSIGENIYDKFKNAEIIVKDGIIQDIRL